MFITKKHYFVTKQEMLGKSKQRIFLQT